MAQEAKKVESVIASIIVSNNLFEISEIKEMKTVNSFYFYPDHYRNVEALIKSGDLSKIKELPLNRSDTFQYYYVVSFLDQKNKLYVATVYDSNELWKDPQLIEIYPV